VRGLEQRQLLDDRRDLFLPRLGQHVVDFDIEQVATGIVEMPRAQHQQRGLLGRCPLVK
jgi:hypothetical protein